MRSSIAQVWRCFFLGAAWPRDLYGPVAAGTGGRAEVRGVPTSFGIKGLIVPGWCAPAGGLDQDELGSIDQPDQPC